MFAVKVGICESRFCKCFKLSVWYEMILLPYQLIKKEIASTSLQ